MKKNRKKKFARISLWLNGLLFLLAAFDQLESGELVFGGIQLLAAVFNIGLALRIQNEKLKRRLHYGVLAMNVVVAISTAIFYLQAGKDYIQYMWFFVALLSAIAMFIQIRKARINKTEAATA